MSHHSQILQETHSLLFPPNKSQRSQSARESGMDCVSVLNFPVLPECLEALPTSQWIHTYCIDQYTVLYWSKCTNSALFFVISLGTDPSPQWIKCSSRLEQNTLELPPFRWLHFLFWSAELKIFFFYLLQWRFGPNLHFRYLLDVSSTLCLSSFKAQTPRYYPGLGFPAANTSTTSRLIKRSQLLQAESMERGNSNHLPMTGSTKGFW